MDIGASIFVPAIADQGIQHVKRIEQEMGIDLLLKLNILELSHISLIPFILHRTPGAHDVPDHEDNQIYADIHDQGYEHQLLKIPWIQRKIEMHGQVQFYYEGGKGRGCQECQPDEEPPEQNVPA